MRILQFFCLLFFAVVWQAKVQAQQLPNQWSLQDCLAYVTEHNITLESLRLDQNIAQQNLERAKAAKLPTLSGTVSHNVVNSNNADPVVGGFQTQASFTGNYGLSTSLTLYNGSYLNNDIKEKALNLQSAQLNIAESFNSMAVSIVQAYYNILLTAESISYLKEVEKTSAEQLRQGKLRYDAGSISRKDYLQFESQLATDQYSLINAQNTYRLNVFSLKQLLQLPADYELLVADTAPQLTANTLLPSLSVAQESARSVRPEIANKKIAMDIAALSIKKNQAGRLPVVSLGGGLSSGYSDNQQTAYFRQLNSNFYQQAAVNISIPIFNRKINKTNIAIAKIQQQQSKLSLRNEEIALDQKIEQVWLQLMNARDGFKSSDLLFKTSAEIYEITNQQLDLGSINMVALLQQKNTYVQALQTFLQAKYSLALYEKLLSFYTSNELN